MVAPEVVQAKVTDWLSVKVPPLGVAVGVATVSVTGSFLVNVTVSTALSVIPSFTAIALMVVVAVSVMDVLYGVLSAVGADPSVV